MIAVAATRYTEAHEWVTYDADKPEVAATVGITDYAQNSLGDIVFVELPLPDTQVSQGGKQKLFCTVLIQSSSATGSLPRRPNWSCGEREGGFRHLCPRQRRHRVRQPGVGRQAFHSELCCRVRRFVPLVIFTLNVVARTLKRPDW